MFQLLLVLFVVSVVFVLIYFKINLIQKHRAYRVEKSIDPNGRVIAFFHPYCNASGGGERVLWSAIRALHSQYPNDHILIYSDNYNVSPSDIISKAQDVFQIDLPSNSIHFVFLKSCRLLNPKLYPICTLLAQSLGSLVVGAEALWRCPPDVVLDTMGASFIYPLFRYLNSSKVIAYVHYPIISSDMIKLVQENRTNFNNHQSIARSFTLTKIKLAYYWLFAIFYRFCGRNCDVVMVNSSWTFNHLTQLWNANIHRTYPPCNTHKLKLIQLDGRDPNLIISLSQFRPEKNHQLQLEIMKDVLQHIQHNHSKATPKLMVIGNCRGAEDQKLVDELHELIQEYGIGDSVELKVNISFEEIFKLMSKASIAIHTMKNEHFGISVVEFLASGLLTLADNSGGPSMDIIRPNETAFLANDKEDFVQLLYRLVNMSPEEAFLIRKAARDSVDRFSQEAFEQAFVTNTRHVFDCKLD